jgi:hypothetical protein
MRASLSTFLTAVALAAFATPASAATVASFTDGGAPLLPGETVFATFDAGSDGGVTGVNFNILTGSSGLGADPATGGQGDPYLSVFGGGTASVSFGPVAFLGLDYGSADTYNTFALLLLDGTTELFTGQDIINVGTADGNQAEPRTNGRLTFTNALNPIVGLTLSSTQNSLEVDRLSSVAAVPEPGTWALMLLGFGAIGVAMRRRRSPRLLQLA